MKKRNHLIISATLALFLAAMAYLLLENPAITYAACGSGPYYSNTDITGYAMGNRYSYPNGQQHYIAVGDAAGHYNRYPWGTCIRLPYNSVTIKGYNGSTTTRSTFYIWDTGPGTDDPNWIDIYFGRYKRYGQACDCPGVPSPGYCLDNAVTNSCDEATIFGAPTWTIQPDSG